MKTKTFRTLAIIAILLISLVYSLQCCKKDSSYKPSYSHKTEKRKTLTLGAANRSFYEPTDLMVQNMNKRLKNVQLKVVSGSNYEDYVNKIHNGVYDIALTNGLEALNAQKYGYKILAKFESDSTYYAVIFANKDSNLKSIKDLKGKKFAISSKGSILGELAPMVFLSQNGLNPFKDLTTRYYPSFETGILNVYLDKCDAGAAWVTSWNNYIESHPEILKKMEVKWKTAPLQNIAIIIKKDVDPKIAEEILNSFLKLDTDINGKRGLQAMDFTKVIRADSTTYAPLLKLKADFDQLPK